jgi:hypothetical protein
MGLGEGESVRVVVGELSESELRESCELIEVPEGATVIFTGEGIFQTAPPDSCDVQGTSADVPDFISERVRICDVGGELRATCRPAQGHSTEFKISFSPKLRPGDDSVAGEISLTWIPDDGFPVCRQTHVAVLERLPN